MAAVGMEGAGQQTRFLAASSTTAPAPSPNRTQVPRSFQSRMREKTSAPTTRAHLCEPERMNFSAMVSA
jgi:hypothetical protein